ncbi:universal stress protein [Herbidospora yilanensis]|uniref:universal stress protein n=1 Tax=Herbidospora yilanensis TaxID=354426 RepID=UPI0007807589|nr:universal stress protein [Herbidospora yilanensis]
MSPIIVAGADGSVSALAAVEYAAQDAARRGGALRIVYVREPWAGVRLRDLDAIEQDHGAQVLATAERRARARVPDLEISARVATGDVVNRLKDEAERADTIVVGSRGVGGFAGMVLGSVGLGLAGRTPGPVVVVREAVADTRGKVLVGYDGTEDADVALEFAFAEADRRGAGLEAVYAWRPPSFTSLGAGYDNLIHCVYEERNDFVRQKFMAWQGKHPNVASAQTGVSGHPVEALSDMSRTADLVIAGCRGLGSFAGAMLGSVGHGLLHHAHCPVAIVSADVK